MFVTKEGTRESERIGTEKAGGGGEGVCPALQKIESDPAPPLESQLVHRSRLLPGPVPKGRKVRLDLVLS